MMKDIFFSLPATFDIYLSSNVTAGLKNCNNILFLVNYCAFSHLSFSLATMMSLER